MMPNLLFDLYRDLLEYPVIEWYGSHRWVFRLQAKHPNTISALPNEVRFLDQYYYIGGHNDQNDA